MRNEYGYHTIDPPLGKGWCVDDGGPRIMRDHPYKCRWCGMRMYQYKIDKDNNRLFACDGIQPNGDPCPNNPEHIPGRHATPTAGDLRAIDHESFLPYNWKRDMLPEFEMTWKPPKFGGGRFVA